LVVLYFFLYGGSNSARDQEGIHDMALQLTDDQKRLINEKNFAHIATINKDGSPQVSPVWIDFDGTHVIINSEDKRLKVRNIKRDGRVSLSIQDGANPYHYIEIRGKVVEVTPKGGNEGIDALAKKYMGLDKYPMHKDGDVRVVIKILPEHVAGQ
jgi:PPOX class probable F420-dependent enzyme